MKSAGSSPLARGLPCAPRGPSAGVRIIPARAGFTRPQARAEGRGRDHPRSRGVYRASCSSARRCLGSSPLARGLHRPGLRPVPPRRIIPARAGFTRSQRAHRGWAWDHPRSRGVYWEKFASTEALPGSSPLARGLPGRLPPGRLAGGIIPARAGFTRARDSRGSQVEDHPRSRGVYTAHRTRTADETGSSPLARGLHDPGARAPRPRRIIPARAGFTSPSTPPASAPWDHPRSRGVYSAACIASAEAGGSSPLARGLRMTDVHRAAILRIIPARAGFTPGAGAPRLPARDHPRSRGVYSTGRRRARSSTGSSPLARGLRSWPSTVWASLRIIPARAGFTWSRGGAPRCRWDHPRSRGVYAWTASVT
mgnify:CR=1 FL=1